MTDRQKEKAFTSFVGRRKGDPKPVEIPAPRRWFESWIFRVAFTLAVIWIAAAVLVGCGDKVAAAHVHQWFSASDEDYSPFSRTVRCACGDRSRYWGLK